MFFNSSSYLIFLPFILLIVNVCSAPHRWMVLLVASFVFYGALNAWHLPVVLLTVAIITYYAGIRIETVMTQRIKLIILWTAIGSNLLMLVILKYLHLLNIASTAKTSAFMGVFPVISTSAISIGVSYYVFQAISYLVDIYLEMEKAERRFGIVALYLAFFPKLLQGPIERAGTLIPQLKQKFAFSSENFSAGLLLIGIGMVKKVVIADRLAFMVDSVYGDVHNQPGIAMLMATYYYALQIYFDFSGYTDIALGSARMFNVTLTQNFNAPYAATSIADFWRRWHISFSRWILDYIFSPLQMSLRNWGKGGAAFALVATFLISGVWHGIGWGFLVWGGLHGLYMGSALFYRPIKAKLHAALRINAEARWFRFLQAMFVFHLVCLAWIFFRANNLGDAFHVLQSLPDAVQFLMHTSPRDVLSGKINLSMGRGLHEVLYIIAGMTLLLVGKYVTKKESVVNYLPVRWAYYYALIYAAIFLDAGNSAKKFIYLQF